MVYKIEVSCYPSGHKKEYFWVLKSLNTSKDDSQWCVSTAGWGLSYEDAWEQAKTFYKKYKER